MHSTFKSGTALFLALGATAGAVAPLVTIAPAFAQVSFSDVSSNYWSASFIQALATRDIIAGFPDGTFRPDEPVTRAQFAAIVRKAFPNAPRIRTPINFSDVSGSYWARQAIQDAYATGFLAGYPDGTFRPNENISRAQALVALSNGLSYTASGAPESVLQVYSDAGNIPGFARNSIAAATERRIVVNYPNVQVLNPTQVGTRAEVAAFVYQALVSSGQVTAISSPYIVGQAPTQPQAVRIPSGTAIPVRYTSAQKILLGKNESQPTAITLTVAQNIVTSDGTVLIPAGSTVAGQLVVANNAAQFNASEITINGQRLPIAASSNPITRTETIRRGANVGTILKDAALGSAAAAGIAGVTGDRTIKAGEVLIGTGIGALAGLIFGGERLELISIQPNTDLNLSLTSDLTLPRQ